MSFLHYVTYKYIVIKDKRLGVAYYSLAIVIVLYTFGQIVINKAYLQVRTRHLYSSRSRPRDVSKARQMDI